MNHDGSPSRATLLAWAVVSRSPQRHSLAFYSFCRRKARQKQARNNGDQLPIDADEVMLALSPDCKDPGVRQQLQVVRDGRLGQIEALGDLAARQLSRSSNLLDHPEALRMRERLERSNNLRIAKLLHGLASF